MNISEAIVAGVPTPATDAQPAAVAKEIKPEGTQDSPEVADAEESAKPEGDKPKELSAAEELEKLRKAKSRDDRKIGKLTALKYQHQKELEELRARVSKPAESKQQNDEPKESDFQTYGEYLKAVARYEAKNLVSETKKEDSEKQAKSAEEEWESERAEAIDENHAEAQKAFSDFNDVMDEIADAKGIIPLSPHVRKALLEADNGAYALYALAKEGLLDQVNAMPPMKAAMVIARMEDKGVALSKVKTTTKAPTPMTPAKGTASGTKDPSQMTDAEFNAWRRASIARKR